MSKAGLKQSDNSRAATRPQGMFLEILKNVDLLDKKVDAFMIEMLRKVNIIDEQLRILVRLSQGEVHPQLDKKFDTFVAKSLHNESAAERDEPVQTSAGAAAEWFVSRPPHNDLPPSLLERLEKTQDGGFKLKVGVSKEKFHDFNQEMWANGYKYVPKRGWYPR